ncbi:tetratricopeptide repeat protein [Urbifossiella limnaea]|uniref:Sel1 repeat protein n=1 Tax=Urbifossiella limnaea TaxID=2528023 RepID=A0A517Y1N8_9BACT|nr:SEL1-like repeat protein [Urbifossiella limnaea]QDU23665.1 Sel1 repeat protein [Urbifossiella limnaea]
MPTIDDAVRAAEAGDLRAARATAAGLAKAGDPTAMRLLGHFHLDGAPTPDDVGLAAYWFFQAWQAGVDEAERDIVRVRAELEHAAHEMASAEARVALGLILMFGHDAPDAAANYFGAAAEAGHPEGLRMLAFQHAEGRGVPRDPAAARELYRRAADAGDPFAPVALAGMLDAGVGGARDRDGAIRYLRRAADAGAPDADQRLAELLAERNRDRRDANEAVQRLVRAAAAGPADAAYRVDAADGSWSVLVRDQGRTVAMPGLTPEELVGLPED